MYFDSSLSYIISGETSSLNKKVANFLKVIIERNCLDKENINFSYEINFRYELFFKNFILDC